MNSKDTLNANRFSNAAGAGLRVFPGKPRDKQPAVKWSKYRKEPPTHAELAAWDASDFNLCIITGDASGVIVVDVDSPEAQQLVDSLDLSPTPTVRTARGRHLYFKVPPYLVRNSVNVGGVKLNPCGRRQTKKYRPTVPIARQGRSLFDETKGFIVKTGSARKGFYTMAQELGLPGDRESGMKLIRRSMADLIRARLVTAGRSDDELSVFLGHRKISSVSELYAPFNPGYLHNVRAIIEEIANEIEAGCQGAFSPQKHRTG